MTCSRVGEIDDSEVDLATLAWSRIVATFGDRSNHEVLAMGSTKRSGVWRAWGRVLIRLLTPSFGGLANPRNGSRGTLPGGGARRMLSMALPPLQRLSSLLPGTRLLTGLGHEHVLNLFIPVVDQKYRATIETIPPKPIDDFG